MSLIPLHSLRLKVADENVAAGIVPTDDAPEWFDHALPMLAPAIERAEGRLEPEDVRERLADGRMHLFLFWQREPREMLGALVTEFVLHPRGKALVLCLLGGTELIRWLDRLLEVEAFAREEGCRWIELSGRFGWERVLRGLGYQRLSVALGKELQ